MPSVSPAPTPAPEPSPTPAKFDTSRLPALTTPTAAADTQAEIAALLAKLNGLLGTSLQLPQAASEEPLVKPELPAQLDSIYRSGYADDTLCKKQAAYLACECISLGSAGLEALQYLHKHFKLEMKHILDCRQRTHDPTDMLPNVQPMSVRWMAAPGVLDVIAYLHNHMCMTKEQLKRMRHFDIFMILASGNIDLLEYLYLELGFHQCDFWDVHNVSPVGNWDWNDQLSQHTEEFLDKYVPMDHVFATTGR